MNDAPLISVVTPAYNVGPWIGQAMDSVLSQTEGRIEYVVVDDGSTDDTAAIVAERAESDPRLRLVRTENGGSGRARNVGITATSAPFVAFLDGDDRWHRALPEHRAGHVERRGAARRRHVQPHAGAAGERPRGRDALAARGHLRPRPPARRPQPAAQRQLAGDAAVVLRRGRHVRREPAQRGRLRDVAAHRGQVVHPGVPGDPALARRHAAHAHRLDQPRPHRPLPGAGDDPRRVRAADAALPPGPRVRAARRLRLPRRPRRDRRPLGGRGPRRGHRRAAPRRLGRGAAGLAQGRADGRARMRAARDAARGGVYRVAARVVGG